MLIYGSKMTKASDIGVEELVMMEPFGVSQKIFQSLGSRVAKML